MEKKLFGTAAQRGFTLIEIMVVVVILGILGALVFPKVMERPDTARVVAAKQQIKELQNALDFYRMDNYGYPSTDQGLQALVEKPAGTPEPRNWKVGGYMAKIPNDPWGQPFQYLSPGSHGEVDIFTYGADGRPGGEGKDADIGNWNLE